jgi:hypothetical protein
MERFQVKYYYIKNSKTDYEKLINTLHDICDSKLESVNTRNITTNKQEL